MQFNNPHQSKTERKVLAAETKWKRLLQQLQDLEDRVVQSIRLADPSLDAHGRLVQWNQGKLNLLVEIEGIIQELESGTDDVDANTVSDFLESEPAE